jgi:hypothetical protein
MRERGLQKVNGADCHHPADIDCMDELTLSDLARKD